MQGASKFNGTHQLLFYDDDVNILGRSVHILKENAEALVVGNKYIGLGGNGDNLSTWSCHEIGTKEKFKV